LDHRYYSAALRGALILFFTSGMLFGQSQDARGNIVGRVTDASGAVIPGADVRATNIATGVVAASKTNESGNYTLPFLVPAIYSITAELTGFKRFTRENVQVRVNENIELNIEDDGRRRDRIGAGHGGNAAAFHRRGIARASRRRAANR